MGADFEILPFVDLLFLFFQMLAQDNLDHFVAFSADKVVVVVDADLVVYFMIGKSYRFYDIVLQQKKQLAVNGGAVCLDVQRG